MEFLTHQFIYVFNHSLESILPSLNNIYFILIYLIHSQLRLRMIENIFVFVPNKSMTLDGIPKGLLNKLSYEICILKYLLRFV